ncbi:hypothetical protein KEJ18_03305 [Candidatus Bathyarchaeota archaeon]|nr:hypothetical protein [Candidatus Bathyarchaeota archaeon]
MGKFCSRNSLDFVIVLIVSVSVVAVVNYAWAMNFRDTALRDPTYQEVLDFIALDQTDKNIFSMDNYTCLSFATDVRNHALMKGIKCGLVYVVFAESSHTIVCFNTVDQGLVYVEPQNDAVVNPRVGEPYWDRTQYSPPPYDDRIIYIAIVWNNNVIFLYN